MSTPLTREERLNNPLGIKRDGTVWLGMTADQPDPIFVSFIDAPHGIRAAVKILESYRERHNIDTIAGAIYRWSPPEENDTVSYISEVCEECCCDEDTPLDPRSVPMLRAMIRHENGPDSLLIYTDAVIQAGIDLA